MADQKRSRVARSLIFALVAGGLIWALVSHSLVAALVRIAPSYALWLRPDDPAALVVLVDRTIEASRRAKALGAAPARFDFKGPVDQPGAPTSPTGALKGDAPVATDDAAESSDRELIRRSVLSILSQEPGHARALAILGALKREAGADDEAAILMRASARRTLREPVPHAWLINDAIKQNDWSLVMRQVDILMRMHDQSIVPLTPLVAQMVETPEAADFVKEVVKEAPPWRTAFMSELLGAIKDARTPLDLLLTLKGTSTPPTVIELRSYLNFLIQRKYYDLAYYTWLQFLTPQQLATVGPVYNGGFEARPSGLPFDWVLPTDGTAAVSIARRADQPSSRALVVHFGQGRVELSATSQLLRLRPGRHRIAGEAMGEVVGRRSVRWRVACLGERTRQIGESEMFVGEIKEWTPFSFPVIVPDEGCAIQRLSLILDARTPSERLTSGTLWFDDVSIRRETATDDVGEPKPPSQSQPRQR